MKNYEKNSKFANLSVPKTGKKIQRKMYDAGFKQITLWIKDKPNGNFF